ncbi:uncharacterized protein LOC142640258 [Castanea sativa]|uniref:uncharacterized protein LOC142640258 n=1 Tax=Castanea sativa TaxID=21020 RepID=UPI003F6511FB
MEVVGCEWLEKVIISNDKEKYFQVGAQLPPQEKEELMMFLRENIDMSFLVAIQGYHQIPLALDDQEKTAFVTPTRNYHYKVMPFDLKNAGATYQRMMTRMFEPQLGKFLGYVVTHRGIEVNLDQVKTEECALAFQQLKEYLSRPPVMSRPKEDEVLFAYIVVATYAINLVLVLVDSGVQGPVYYMSKLLHEAEICYLPLEKVILAVMHATYKLPHYFQSHTIVVLTQLPLKLLLQSVDYTRRIVKWGTILGAFDIKYMPRISVKGQVLADLVVEFAEPSVEEEEDKQNIDGKSIGMVSLQEPTSWKVYVDGASNQRGSGVKLVIVSPEMIVIDKSLRLSFLATNNEAEYEALLSRFKSFTLVQVLRSRNTHVDSLATLATSSTQSLPQVILVEDLYKPTEMKGDMVRVHQIKAGPSWMDFIVLFLREDILPEEKSEANKFDSKVFRRYCCDLGITNKYSILAYPQGNGQAVVVNKVIVNELKKRLDNTKEKWVEELLHVLWTYQATHCRSTRETPFSMTYRVKAVIPLETSFPTLRTSSFTPRNNDGVLERSLDLVEERRENAMVQLSYYQHKLKQGYDSNVRLRPLAPGDLILRKVFGIVRNPAWGKLWPNWEGSYHITLVVGIETYYLEDLD